ncbi:MAG TPA: tripartite tricarboxylate transporter substrate binding protein [Alphaproteobacteria bacterium]|nr:tripartite tricarboxylate transporter substrate binding protein [Alphaproteobacteria bacterium]
MKTWITPAVAGLLLLAGTAADAQDSAWPAKPIHFIVPFQPGSSSDVIARIVAQPLSAKLGQQIVVENKAGGSGIIGSEAVAHARPDGYTMGLANTSTHAAVVATLADVPFDPVKDFTPVAMIAASPFALMATPGLPARDVRELITLAKAKPYGLNYASAGIGTLSHLAGELFEKMADIKLTHVPYRGTEQSSLDLMEGRVELLFGTIAPSLQQVRAGRIKALATTGDHRNAMLPDTPTIAEAGLPGYDAVLWSAIVLPARVPADIVTKLNRQVVAVVDSPDVRAALNREGVEADPGTPQELAARMQAEVAKWRGVAASAGIVAKK